MTKVKKAFRLGRLSFLGEAFLSYPLPSALAIE
jgi:hypothetical protein